MSRAVHPEAMESEVHIGNVYGVDFRRIGWKSKRLGKMAMGSDGEKLKGGNMKPVFVGRAEIEAAGVPIPDAGAVDHQW